MSSFQTLHKSCEEKKFNLQSFRDGKLKFSVNKLRIKSDKFEPFFLMVKNSLLMISTNDK